MIKRLERTIGCFAKAADDEPLFVLRAQDKLAPVLIRLWASLAEMGGLHPAKARDARLIADEMELWPNRKMPD